MAFINELVEQIPVEAVREAVQLRLSDFFNQAFEKV
jgi:Fe-S cluster assembly protein SufD